MLTGYRYLHSKRASEPPSNRLNNYYVVTEGGPYHSLKLFPCDPPAMPDAERQRAPISQTPTTCPTLQGSVIAPCSVHYSDTPQHQHTGHICQIKCIWSGSGRYGRAVLRHMFVVQLLYVCLRLCLTCMSRLPTKLPRGCLVGMTYADTIIFQVFPILFSSVICHQSTWKYLWKPSLTGKDHSGWVHSSSSRLSLRHDVGLRSAHQASAHTELQRCWEHSGLSGPSHGH